MQTCEHCEKRFVPRPGGGKKFCSTDCYHEHTKGVRVAERIDFHCAVCAKPFQFAPGQLAAYRKSWGKDPKYCSMKCSDTGRKRDSEARKCACPQCGKPVLPQRDERGILKRVRFCSNECRKARRQAGIDRLSPPEEREITRRVHERSGYVRLRFPNRDGMRQRTTAEHRYVMEQNIGRELLPEETVHHINGIRDDNRLENLELFSSRHGPGQRVVDKVEFAIGILRLYPEFAAAAGVVLTEVEHQAPSVSVT